MAQQGRPKGHEKRKRGAGVVFPFLPTTIAMEEEGGGGSGAGSPGIPVLEEGQRVALRRWEMENQVQVEPDSIYDWDRSEHEALQAAEPWATDPHYFKKVKVSAVALVKMTMHAMDGDDMEVMGLLQGTAKGDTLIILDAYAVPAKGIEYQVNPGAQSYEYMIAYRELAGEMGRVDTLVGWYHSHPGFGCFLSGIDCSTQMQYQNGGYEPWVALVIDHKRTISSGRVEIKGFRTWPKGYVDPNAPPSEYQAIPLEWIEDFGVHGNEYYSLELEVFKTSADAQLLDLLWQQYWITALSSSPVFMNRQFQAGKMQDVAQKLEQAQRSLLAGRREDALQDGQAELQRAQADSASAISDQLCGVVGQLLKDHLFNRRRLPLSASTSGET